MRNYEELEKKHLGDFEKKTGIYSEQLRKENNNVTVEYAPEIQLKSISK